MPKSVRLWRVPCGKAPSRLAFVAIPDAEAGILNTTQCHQPEPVGASGSKARTAKLLVPWGAPDQLSSGEALAPLQPNWLNTCAFAMGWPGVRSLEASLISACACAPPRRRAATVVSMN